jgi:hypothetical protein
MRASYHLLSSSGMPYHFISKLSCKERVGVTNGTEAALLCLLWFSSKRVREDGA